MMAENEKSGKSREDIIVVQIVDIFVLAFFEDLGI
jgi:hypothetical protein